MGMMQQMFAGFPTTAGAPGVTTDALFKYVSLLLNSNSAVAFNADASTNNFLVKPVATVRNDTFSPFRADGNYSNYFNGSTDYLSIPAGTTGLQFGSGDFTVEAWVYLTSVGTSQVVLSGQGDNATVAGSSYCFYVSGSSTSDLYSGAGSAGVTSPSPAINTWAHVAWVRNGTNFTSYLNGVQVNTVATLGASVINVGAATYSNQIGARGNGANNRLSGYISNLRVLKGTALYTSAFTPSTSPLTSIANTSLLTAQSARFIDNSGSNLAITLGGTPAVKPAIPFTYSDSYGSAYMNGATSGLSSLTMAGNAAVQVTSQDFTIECWVYPTSPNLTGHDASNNFIWSDNDSSANNGGVLITLNATQLVFGWYTSATALTTASASFPASNFNAWSHIAVSRVGSTAYLCVNGVVTTVSCPSTFGFVGGFPTIGQMGAYATNPGAGYRQFSGYMSNFRYVKGTALYTTNFTPPAAPLTAITNTSLLTLQNSSPANNRGFIDSSANNLVVTATGAPTQGTFSPFSQTGWSAAFDGTSDSLSIPATSLMQFGSNDFTIECWIQTTSITRYATIITKGLSSGNWEFSLMLNQASTTSGDVALYTPAYNTAVTPVLLSTGAKVTDGALHHIAVTRSGSTWQLYIDGVSRDTRTGVTNAVPAIPTATTSIGYDSWQANRLFKGTISNMRVVNGTALYTSAFTPPTSPLTAVTNTSLLTLQSNRFIDNSGNNLTISRNGTPKIQASSPFSPTVSWSASGVGGSLYFGGSDYAATPNISVFNLSGSSNFTIEAWVYNTGPGTYRGIFGARPNAVASGWCLYINTNNTLYMGSIIEGNAYADRQMNTAVIPGNSWTHVALVKTGTGYTGYVNGVPGTLLALTGGLNYQSAHPVTVGALGSQGEYPFLGFISNARITVGTAIYTSAFTPPTAPLSPIANTQLLLSGANVGVQDAATNNDFISVGSASGSMVQSKFGASTMYFNGTTDYVYAANPSAAYDFGTGDFTLEFWVYPQSGPVSTYNPAFYTHNSTGGAQWNANGGFRIHHGNILFSNSGQLNFTSAITNNVWTHVALVRVGNTLTAYKNGVANGTLSHTIAIGSPLNQPALGISDSANTGGREFLNGYITGLRITKGQARYTANFTPPTASFPTK